MKKGDRMRNVSNCQIMTYELHRTSAVKHQISQEIKSKRWPLVLVRPLLNSKPNASPIPRLWASKIQELSNTLPNASSDIMLATSFTSQCSTLFLTSPSYNHIPALEYTVLKSSRLKSLNSHHFQQDSSWSVFCLCNSQQVVIRDMNACTFLEVVSLGHRWKFANLASKWLATQSLKAKGARKAQAPKQFAAACPQLCLKFVC